MKYLGIIIVLCVFISESYCSNVGKLDSLSLSKDSISEQKVWNIKLDIYFSKPLPSIVKASMGKDVKLKCEAFMNFTNVKYTINKEAMETHLTENPPDHILQTLMNNVKVYWLKDKKVLLDNDQIKLFTKIDKTNGTISTTMEIKHINIFNEGNYSCVIKQNHEKKQTTNLIVHNSDDNEISKHTSLFPNPILEIDVKGTQKIMSENIKTQNTNLTGLGKKIEPICQVYIGNICAHNLTGHYVYIPFNTTQSALEEKLVRAVQVTKYSNDISSNCEGYALPSLCFSTFPICRNPKDTNDNYFKQVKQLLQKSLVTTDAIDLDNVNTHDLVFENLLSDMQSISGKNIKSASDLFDYRHNSTILRRVCKKDCEILENELCQTEYAIAKRHPHIGQQLTLEECGDLPESDTDCLKVGIAPLMVSDEVCYWENGSGYLGRVSVASDGTQCLEWAKQIHVNPSDHPELAGRHSYCRNPGGAKSQPWCFVEKDGKAEQQLCDIPKCAHKIWIYIVVVFVLLTLIIVGVIVCLCYRNKNKGSASTIRDINLPNADKNIYGNSRLNSPIEMNELITNQNLNNQPHLTRNTRGNGVLQVPQYSLSQIKFLEELGEGAFGKVYKGALKKNGETQYVAVKALKENASTKTKADFRREIELISELTHDNIVCIVGVALREEPLCMLFEFMARGDLHEFLMGRAPPSGKGLPHMRLLNIASNIASGMHYLASHHYVHRDLAARNCLVSDDFVVKISDFGLSRDIYSSDYYRVQSKSLLPVRWMPPESILYGKFTTESDIWSYGVVLWEIYSYGLQPYYGFSNQEVIAMVRAGELLAPPTACPPPMYGLMRDCWKHTPQRRPNFEEIVSRLQEWIQMGGCPESIPSELGSICPHRAISSSRDLQERVPLLPAHCSSNGSLTTGSLKKFSTIGSCSKFDDNRSTCSEAPPLVPKKKHSTSSLIDSDRLSTKETVVRIPNTQFCKDI